jgi:glycosyltransferase involved in cell wall biosynthesis
MDQLSQALITLVLIFSIFNFFTARSIKPTGEPIPESVALLIPMRNEIANAESVLATAFAQVQLDNFKVRVIDDGSTDGTDEVLRKIEDKRFESISSTPLPEGWLGKNYALHQLASLSSEEFLVFIDADVRLEKSAIADSLALLKKQGWDYISPYPRQIARAPLAKLVQPLLQWSWFASLPLRLIERSKSKSTVVANGQFFIVRNKIYQRASGHNAIKSEVLDDMELARSLRRTGGIGSVVDGSKIARCEMYQDSATLIAGYSKSQWRAFGGTIGALAAICILFFSSIYPAMSAMRGETWGLYGYLALVISRLLVAARTRSTIVSAPLHPIAIAVWIGLIIRSLVYKRSGQLQWRGRKI